jgi:PAS domain S-box-containing protein
MDVPVRSWAQAVAFPLALPQDLDLFRIEIVRGRRMIGPVGRADRLRALLEAVTDLAIVLTDAQGVILAASAGTQAIVGAPPAELVGRHLRLLCSPEDQARGLPDTVLAAATRDGRALDDGWRTRRDGGHFYAETSVTCAREGEAVAGYTVIVRDITVRRAAEEELRLSESRYRTQFDFAPEAIVTVDADSEVFVEANDNATRLFALPRKALLLRGPVEVSPPLQPDGQPSGAAMSQLIRRALDGEKLIVEWAVRDGRGVDIPTEIRMVRLPGPGRNLVRVSLIDVTPRKEAERLARRSAELVEQNRTIQAANRLKSEFLANMSHELRTPLNAILGFAELIHDGKAGPLTAEQREYLGDVLTSGQHLLSLINGVLDLAKVEAGKLEVLAEPLDLDDLVAEVCDVLRSLAAQKGILLASRVEPALAAGVVGDAPKLKQILYNFGSNALKFTPEGGRVEIAVGAEDATRFRLAVHDTGIGVRVEDQPKLFQEFSQLDGGFGKRYQGTGLGLALTKRLVELLGGHVGVDSAPGAGSTFFAVLPRSVARVAKPGAAGPGARPRATVLTVEHDAEARAWLAAALGDAGHEVEAAHDTADALARCATRRFDAIAVDAMLPGGAALELARALRDPGPNRDTPVVLVTLARAREGIHDVLAKPLPREALIAALRSAGVAFGQAARVLVVDGDVAARRWAADALAEAGCQPLVRADAAAGLAAAAVERPSVVMVDPTAPRWDGVEFLARLRSATGGARMPVIVWSTKSRTDAGREQLLGELREKVGEGQDGG